MSDDANKPPKESFSPGAKWSVGFDVVDEGVDDEEDEEARDA